MRECEELLKFVQRSRDSWLDLAGVSCQIATHVPSMPEAEALCQLFTIGKKSQAGQAVCSRLELATQPSREVKSLEHPV